MILILHKTLNYYQHQQNHWKRSKFYNVCLFCACLILLCFIIIVKDSEDVDAQCASIEDKEPQATSINFF